MKLDKYVIVQGFSKVQVGALIMTRAERSNLVEHAGELNEGRKIDPGSSRKARRSLACYASSRLLTEKDKNDPCWKHAWVLVAHNQLEPGTVIEPLKYYDEDLVKQAEQTMQETPARGGLRKLTSQESEAWSAKLRMLVKEGKEKERHQVVVQGDYDDEM